MKRPQKIVASNASSRPKQERPKDFIIDMLRIIRGQFCPDLSNDEWYPHVQFLKRVLTYGAAWLNKRGVTIPPDRYQAIYQNILNGIKQHGQTGQVRYWPRYLLHCVQEHFKHHGEEYYEEGKSIRATVERNMLAFQRAHDAPRGVDPIETYAQAHAVLSAPKRRKKTPAKQAFLPL
jgi:predicted SprT family Zn-dependent metalloprotease